MSTHSNTLRSAKSWIMLRTAIDEVQYLAQSDTTQTNLMKKAFDFHDFATLVAMTNTPIVASPCRPSPPKFTVMVGGLTAVLRDQFRIPDSTATPDPGTVPA